LNIDKSVDFVLFFVINVHYLRLNCQLLFYTMKRFIFIVYLLIFISCTKKESENYSIQGQISPVNTKYLILRQQTDIERQLSTIIDTLSISKDGKFSTNLTLKPHLYTLHIDIKNNITLAIGKGQHLTIDINNYESKITGSKDTDALIAYENFRKKSLDSLVQSVRKQVKKIKESEHPDQEKILKLEQLEVENYEKHLTELNDFIKNKMGTTLGLYATSIRWKGAENLPYYDSLVTVFNAQHPDLDISKKLRGKVTRLQQTSVGGTATTIEMKNVEEALVNLTSIHKKYTLIDFWASWCGPCRSESKTLNSLYKKYNANGFEIYGISLDSHKEKWLKALEKDHRIWTNVSSLEAFKTKAAFDYTVTALPMNYLIDAEYKIVGKNLHEGELNSLLDRLFNN